MELKYEMLAGGITNAGCSNRTFMELKYAKEELVAELTAGSNRTFMELK